MLRVFWNTRQTQDVLGSSKPDIFWFQILFWVFLGRAWGKGSNSKAVRRLSENSSILETGCFPDIDDNAGNSGDVNDEH